MAAGLTQDIALKLEEAGAVSAARAQSLTGINVVEKLKVRS